MTAGNTEQYLADLKPYSSVVAVIDRRIVAPAGQSQPDPDQIRLWLIVGKFGGRWLVDNLGLAI